MRILLVADIHSSFTNFEEILKNVDFDAVFIAGDITDFRVEDVRKADEIVSKYDTRCIAVHGNCDYESVLEVELDAMEFIHGRSVKIDDLTIFGVGGSGYTPFNTPSEYSEEEIESMLRSFEIVENSILLSHCPPKGVLDRTFSGVHAGCSALRKFADQFDLVICGHIHEAYGVHSKDGIFAVNPGPAAWKRYAILELPVLAVELHRL